MLKKSSFIFFAYAPEDREYAQRLLKIMKGKDYRIITSDYPEYYPDELVYEMLDRNIEDSVADIVILSKKFVEYSNECKFRSEVNLHDFAHFIYKKTLVIIYIEDDAEFLSEMKKRACFGFFDPESVFVFNKSDYENEYEMVRKFPLEGYVRECKIKNDLCDDVGVLTGEKRETGNMFFNYGDTEYLYSGDIKNGKRHGAGICFWQDFVKYEGEWKDDQITGYGRLENRNGMIYEGELINGRKHGKGKLFHNNHIYECEWKDDMFDGYGTITDSKGNIHKGCWKNNAPVGNTTLITKKNGFTEECERSITGMKHGKGKFIFNDGHTYEGEWRFGRMYGEWKWTASDKKE